LSRKLPIFYSAILLTMVNLLLRVVGTSFQVYLSRRIGAEGIGLLQLTLSVGSMALVAGTAGIRTATMYLTAEEIGKKRPQNITWVLSACIVYSLIFSCMIASVAYFFAPFFADRWIGNVAIVDTIRLYAAFLPVNCLCGVMVGYFTGANRIGTLAIVEIFEQFCVMAATVLFLTFWAGHNPERSCFSVVLGGCVGSCITLCCLILLRIREKPVTGKPIAVARRLADTALPLAVADDLRTGISTLENLMVPKRLALYPGTASPLAAFGIVSGMVFPILTFPAALQYGLIELLIPEFARCNAAGSRKRIRYLVVRSLRLSMLYGLLAGGILFLSADSLCLKLYKSREAGIYLRWFSVLAVMLYCDSITDAMIKGLGQQKASVRYNIITNIMDVVLLFFLLPKYGIKGYFVSFFVTHAINFFLSLRRLLRISELKLQLSTPVLTGVTAVIAVGSASFLPLARHRVIAFIIIWVCLLHLFGIVQKRDLIWLKGLIRLRRQKASSRG